MKKMMGVITLITILCVLTIPLNGCAKKASEPQLTAMVSGNCETLSISLQNCSDYETVSFPVWSEENGQDDIVWYPAEKDENGNWNVTADLKQHNSAGIYQVHVYGTKGTEQTMLTATTVDVAYAVAPDLTAEVSEDCSSMKITLRRHEDYESVSFPTWSEENGQDDIVWYPAEKDAEGNWMVVVDLTKHHSAGIYQIHAYGEKNGEQSLLITTAVNVDHAVEADLTAEVSQSDKTMTITLRGHSDCESVSFPVWSLENEQDDLVWYLAEKNEEGNWTATVDLTKHGSIGVYVVHAYGTIRGEQTILGDTTLNVAF